MKFFVFLPLGELPEWSIGADSKSVEPFGVPGVRIPHSPQAKRRRDSVAYFCIFAASFFQILFNGSRRVWECGVKMV